MKIVKDKPVKVQNEGLVKLLVKRSEVARLYNVSYRTVRVFEEKGFLNDVSPNGIVRYRPDEVLALPIWHLGKKSEKLLEAMKESPVLCDKITNDARMWIAITGTNRYDEIKDLILSNNVLSVMEDKFNGGE